MSDENDAQNKGGGGTEGSEFKPITSQEELDRTLAKRLERERSKFADYDDLRAKASKFDELEQASKSELEREREARAAAEAELGKYRQRDQVASWAKEVAKERPELAPLLRGSTKDELTEHFEQLKSIAAATRRTATPPGKPSRDGEKGRAAAALRELRRGA